MKKSEEKAIEMVDKYGELAPDVVNEILSTGLLYNYLKVDHINMSKQSKSFWLETKKHCQFLLKKPEIKREIRLKKILEK